MKNLLDIDVFELACQITLHFEKLFDSIPREEFFYKHKKISSENIDALKKFSDHLSFF